LAALLLFQHARAPARTGSGGEIVLLADQDRSLWDRAAIAEGMGHLRAAMTAECLSAYHLEAGIASVHATARSWEETDWTRILGYYDALLEIAPSPVAEVNRAVAHAMIHGPGAGLALLDALGRVKGLSSYPPFHIARAELLMRLGRGEPAAAALETVLTLTISKPERLLFERKLAALQNG
jgi:RNA polymerase sigma-70 factor (ECF subfamily)